MPERHMKQKKRDKMSTFGPFCEKRQIGGGVESREHVTREKLLQGGGGG